MDNKIYTPVPYMHELDQRSLELLMSNKDFNKFYQAFDETSQAKVDKIQYLSSAIKLGPKQMPEIYNLLPPICHTLQIKVPDLYLIRDNQMNAYTAGNKDPYICITQPLVDALTLEMISSVLAHECGHIACRHYMYHFLARQILTSGKPNFIEALTGISKKKAQQTARLLFFWDRCSELSADRAAVLCDGTSDHMIDALIRIHGYGDTIDRDAFIKQALELKNFTAESTANRTMEAMLVANDDHPRLAVRAYECYEWSLSDTYRMLHKNPGAAAGNSYTKESSQEGKTVKTARPKISISLPHKNRKSAFVPQPAYMAAENKPAAFCEYLADTKPEEEEILAAEVDFGDTTANSLTEDSVSVEEQLAAVNRKLESLTCQASKEDYAFAVICGIVSGIIDAFFVGAMEFGEEDFALSNKKVSDFVMKYADLKGKGTGSLKKDIINLEKAYEVAQDNIWKGTIERITPTNHHLADLAHHPTPVGLVSAIIVQFLRVGIFLNKEGDFHIKLTGTTKEELIEIYTPVVITGLLNWLVSMAEHYQEEENQPEIPEGVKTLVRLIADTPAIIEVIKCIDNWFGHMASDMAGSHATAGAGMGIPGVFLSMLYEISGLPILKDSGLPAFVNDLYSNKNKRIDLRKEIPLYKALGKQTIPVILNELLVRTGYFISRLVTEVKQNNGFSCINWENVFPYGNRTIDRMLTVSSITFEAADTVDASVHAALESGGNWVIFSGKFVSRINYIGAARAVVAVVKEVSYERKEAQLIREKMLLTQEQEEKVTAVLDAYRERLSAQVSAYLAEDIEAFMTGMNDIKAGIAAGDSDLVIHGNVTIQRVLGKEPQFTTQDEFDDFMDSDLALKF